jgi:hypothetical protein
MIRPNNKILIIGTLPPPIGGVSIYNERLFDFLQQDQRADVEFIDYKRNPISRVLGALSRHKIIYLNCSSSLFRLALAVIARLLNKKFIVTFHGNMERHSRAVNVIDKLILKFATLSVVLNKQSFNFATRYTKRLFLGTSFIPPVTTKELSPDIKSFLIHCRQNYKIICASNAHNVSTDKFGNEIYQIRFLLDLFNEVNDCCIILSDPSGMYSNYLLKNKVKIPTNVFIIKETHSFFELLKDTDVMLRITTTDGDSISVREALYLHKIVIASDAVDRPAGVITVPISKREIKEKLKDVIAGKIHPQFVEQKSSGEQMLKIFESLS